MEPVGDEARKFPKALPWAAYANIPVETMIKILNQSKSRSWVAHANTPVETRIKISKTKFLNHY